MTRPPTPLDKLCVGWEANTAVRIAQSTKDGDTRNGGKCSTNLSTSDSGTVSSTPRTHSSFGSSFLARAIVDPRFYTQTEYRRHYGNHTKRERLRTPPTAKTKIDCETPRPLTATPYKKGSICERLMSAGTQKRRTPPKDMPADARSVNHAPFSASWDSETSSSRSSGRPYRFTPIVPDRCESSSERAATRNTSTPKPASKDSEEQIKSLGDSSCAEDDIQLAGGSSGESVSDAAYPSQAKPMVLNLENIMHSTPEVLELELGRLRIDQLEKLDAELDCRVKLAGGLLSPGDSK